MSILACLDGCCQLWRFAKDVQRHRIAISPPAQRYRVNRERERILTLLVSYPGPHHLDAHATLRPLRTVEIIEEK